MKQAYNILCAVNEYVYSLHHDTNACKLFEFCQALDTYNAQNSPSAMQGHPLGYAEYFGETGVKVYNTLL